MKVWPAAAAALVAIETAAVACSCLATTDPVELKQLAPDAARNAVALVEVETVVPYQDSNGTGDTMRVIRTLAGTAAGEFRVERRHIPSGASCDLLFDKGQRDIVILYPSTRQVGSEPTYRISGLCTDHLLDQPVFRAEIERLIGKVGERG